MLVISKKFYLKQNNEGDLLLKREVNM